MYKALSGNVIVKHIVGDRKSSGGIILAGNAMSTPHDVVKVEVLSVYEGNDQELRIGDSVLVPKHSLTKLATKDTVDFCSVKLSQLIAVVQGEVNND